MPFYYNRGVHFGFRLFTSSCPSRINCTTLKINVIAANARATYMGPVLSLVMVRAFLAIKSNEIFIE